MEGHPFFLGMTNSEAYTRDTTNMRMVVRRTDIESTLIPATLASGQSIVVKGKGQADIVDVVRTVTFNVLCDYFGTPGPADADLRIWATRLFEFPHPYLLRRWLSSHDRHYHRHWTPPIPDLGTLPSAPDNSKSRARRAIDRLAPRRLDTVFHTCWQSFGTRSEKHSCLCEVREDKDLIMQCLSEVAWPTLRRTSSR